MAQQATSLEMSPDDFRFACFNMIVKNEMRPGYLIENGFAQKLNVIFDIDHTLVHSVQPHQVSGFKKGVSKFVVVKFGKS